MEKKNGKGRAPMKTGKSVKKFEASNRGNGSNDAGSAPKTHNMAARRAIIVKTIKRIKNIEEERDALNADIRAILNTEIKGNLGMKIADFKAAKRCYDLEGEDQADYFDTLREVFEAMGKGGEVDFVDALAAQEAKEAKAHTHHEPVAQPTQ